MRLILLRKRVLLFLLILALLLGPLALPTGLGQSAPAAPTPYSPGSSSEFGPEISTLTPTLSWSSVSGGNNYHVAVRQYAGSWDSGPIVLDQGYIYATSYTIPSGVLQAGANYRWNVQAYNSAGTGSAYSSRLYFHTAPAATPPSAPTSLTATAVNSAEIDLSWNAPGGAVTNYKVYRGTSSGGESLYFTTSTAGTTFQNTANVNCGTPYYYKVSAVNNAGEGPQSNEASATTACQPPPVPNAPMGLSANAVSSNQIDLSWSAPSGSTVTNYKIYRGTYSGGESLIYTTNTNGLTFQNTAGLNPCTAYYYQVKAVNGQGESAAYSNEATATTLGCATVTTPGPPTGLSATAVSSTQINLAWNPPSSNGGAAISNYKVYRGTSSGAEQLVFTSQTAGTTFQNTAGLSPGTTYYYYVKAVNSAGDGAQSNGANATTTGGTTGSAPTTSPNSSSPGSASSPGPTQTTSSSPPPSTTTSSAWNDGAMQVPSPWVAGASFTLRVAADTYTAVSIHREGGIAPQAWLFWEPGGQPVDDSRLYGVLTQAAYARTAFLFGGAVHDLDAMTDQLYWDAVSGRFVDASLSFLKGSVSVAGGCIKGAVVTGLTGPVAVGGCVVGGGVVIGTDLLRALAREKAIDLAMTLEPETNETPDCRKGADRFIEIWANEAAAKAAEAQGLANLKGDHVEAFAPMWAAYVEAKTWGTASTYLRSNTEATRRLAQAFDVVTAATELMSLELPTGDAWLKDAAAKDGLKFLVGLAHAKGDCSRIVEAVALMQRMTSAHAVHVEDAVKEGALAVARVTGQYPTSATPIVVYVPVAPSRGHANAAPDSGSAAQTVQWYGMNQDTTKTLAVDFQAKKVIVHVDSKVHDGDTVMLTFDQTAAQTALAGNARVTAIDEAGQRIVAHRAAGLQDVLNPFDDDGRVEYVINYTGERYELFLSFPHFSAWSVEVTPVPDDGQAFVTPTPTLALAVGSVLVATIAVGIGRRRPREP